MVKIAISGKMGSGKTTIANYLVQTYGVQRLSFAGPLKDVAVQLFNARIDGPNKDRLLLQQLGNGMRQIRPSVWIDALLRRIHDHERFFPDKDIVVDDMRYKNEAQALLADGFVLVRIEIDPSLQAKRIMVENSLDAGEVDLDDFDEWDHVIAAEDGDGVLEIIDGIYNSERAKEEESGAVVVEQ